MWHWLIYRGGKKKKCNLPVDKIFNKAGWRHPRIYSKTWEIMHAKYSWWMRSFQIPYLKTKVVEHLELAPSE